MKIKRQGVVLLLIIIMILAGCAGGEVQTDTSNDSTVAITPESGSITDAPVQGVPNGRFISYNINNWEILEDTHTGTVCYNYKDVQCVKGADNEQ